VSGHDGSDSTATGNGSTAAGDELDLPPIPPAEREAAQAVRRLGMALLGRTVSAEMASRVAAQVAALAAEVEAASPERTKVDAFLGYTGVARARHFLTTGHWPAPSADYGEVRFDAMSYIGGPVHPFSAGARYYRDGDEAVARVTVDMGFEGPPGRVHGGTIASIFDEVMGTVFRIRALPSAFTGSLNVRFEAPAPLNVELEFRARLVNVEGRKHFVEAEATGPDGRFASATAVFIQMAGDHMAATYGRLLEGEGHS